MTNDLPDNLRDCHALIKELRDEVKLWKEYADQGASQDEILWVGAIADKVRASWASPNQNARSGCRALVALAMYPGAVCQKYVFLDYLITLACTNRTKKTENQFLINTCIWGARHVAQILGFTRDDVKTHWGQGFSLSPELKECIRGFKPK